MSSSDEDSYSMIFASLKHPIRRKILRILFTKAQTFTDLQKQFDIESSHLTYHIDGLGSLLYKTRDGKYTLSSLGEAAVSMMKNVEEPRATTSVLTHRSGFLKTLTVVLTCVLIASLVFNAFLFIKYADSDKAYNVIDKAYSGLDQAYADLNRTNFALNQNYLQLDSANNRLEKSFSDLNQTYQTLLSSLELHVVRNVHTGIEYATIQDAINNAVNGNTLLVNSGTYDEHVTINKTITLLGANKKDTIIDGSHSGDVVVITSHNVTLNGFTIRNSSNEFFSGAGVHLQNAIDCAISGNVITLNGFAGLEIDDSANNTIFDNIVSSTIGSGVGLIWGDALRLLSSTHNTISGNIIIKSTEYDINLGNSSENQISRNTLFEGTIQMSSSANNTFALNNFMGQYEPELFGDSIPNTSWNGDQKGNYWHDYSGLDDGSNGRVAGDGVGDTDLPWHSVDYYPLTSPVNPIQIVWDNQASPTQLMTNSTISSFRFDQPNKRITFSVTGIPKATGYVNLTILSSLLSGPWQILLD